MHLAAQSGDLGHSLREEGAEPGGAQEPSIALQARVRLRSCAGIAGQQGSAERARGLGPLLGSKALQTWASLYPNGSYWLREQEKL